MTKRKRSKGGRSLPSAKVSHQREKKSPTTSKSNLALNTESVNSVSTKNVNAEPINGINEATILDEIESITENAGTPSVLDGLDALFDAAKTIDFNPHNSVVTMRKTAIELGGLGFKVFPIHFLTQTRGAWECSCCEWERWRAKKEGDRGRVKT